MTLDEMNEVFDRDLRHVAESLGGYHHVGVTLGADTAARLPTRTDEPDLDEIVTVTWTEEGVLAYSSDPRVQLPFLRTEALTEVDVGTERWVVYTDVSPNGIAQAAQRSAARRDAALEAVGKILLPIIAMSALVGAMMVFALRRGLRPLDQAARDVAARSAVSLEPMPTEAVPAEVSPLVRAINSLMGKLAESMSVQRRFLADAAHELRTPMTALRLQVQLLERAQDEASRREAVAELEYGVARSAHLVEQLLQVARSGPDGQPVRIEPVDLGELVRSVVGRMSVKADAKHIDLGAQTGKALRVDADPQALLVLLNNLVENALRYTPAGGTVDVGAALRDGHAVLYVVDDGPGIPEAERPRVFDRFYGGADRAAGAGDGSGGDSGSGLGLAIVKAIAQRHGAQVSLHTPVSGRGLEVRVVFAAAPA
ncbi:MAG: two-component sensor histidine kinase [Burkholderiaceae bacterium]|nr:two-component sensor histidine kinase [Burkholderiaceae bacterium]